MRLKLLAFLVGVTACSSPTDLPDGPPTVDGPVVTVSASSVHIKPVTENCGIVFRMDDDTRILMTSANGTVVEASVADVTVGRRAQAWASGPIAESCPGQADAEVVLLF